MSKPALAPRTFRGMAILQPLMRLAGLGRPWPVFPLRLAIVALVGTVIALSLTFSATLAATVRTAVREVPLARSGANWYRFSADVIRSNDGAFPGTRVRRAAQSIADDVHARLAGAAAATNPSPLADPMYPLKVSDDARYLVDQVGTPFMVVGDSPQAIIGKLSLDEAELFLADRKAAGFNSVWVNLLCNDGTGCRSDGATFDGVPPFLVAGDLATPNEEYFSRVDAVLASAQRHGVNVFLDPIEMIGWRETLRQNGTLKAHRYGAYLGERYKDVPNIIWMSGNDFQTWHDDGDDQLVRSVAQGIREQDRNHLHTVELNYPVSASLDSDAWSKFVDLNAVYTYRPTYAKLLREYNRAHVVPTFMIEASYEFEQVQLDLGTSHLLRRQEYWSMLSGATGQFYGNKYTWQFIDGWKQMLNTAGSIQMRHVVDLFASRPWYSLVPDQDHHVVIRGYGTFTEDGPEIDSDYVTAARTSDGSLVLAYMPTLRTLTVDMAQLRAPAIARWYDPTNGTYRAAADSLVANAGTVDFTPPGMNGDGDGDWVLVLETASTSGG